MISDMVLACAKHEAEKERKERELKERGVHALERIAAALETLAGLKSRAPRINH